MKNFEDIHLNALRNKTIYSVFSNLVQFLQLQFNNDILQLNRLQWSYFILRRFSMDLSAIVYNGGVTWEHSGGCPQNSS
jgi:hypothetical protein